MRSTIKKYLAGNSSETEQKALLDWIRQDKHLTEFQDTKKEWEQQIIREDIPSQYQESWNNLQQTLFGRMQSDLRRTQRRLIFFRYAALLVLLISIPSLLYFYSQTKQGEQLAYTTVTADFGQISKVLLPDSTVIWINSGSTIRYNNQFSSSNRDIELKGEAFFKVHKNKNLPLVVSSEDLRVKVLGTEFNVISYPEESSIQVILENGKVELSSASHSNFRQVMKPGELASYDKAKKQLSLSMVNTELYTSWKDGMINIYNLPLSELVIRLEKRYNQKFVVDDAIRNLPYTFTIKNEDLHSVLRLMEKITPVDAIQKGNVIELKYNKGKIHVNHL
ncbi:MAG TPA: FecR domain-containing protein [Prolixibacteraceae bacterium]|jgi:ferric-dicitrate binding protein FerR (iron transport regulator)